MTSLQTEERSPQPAGRLFLTAYRISDGRFDIVPASATRAWMDATPDRYAYRCLPMVLANQAGWFITTGVEVRATWNGGEKLADLHVEAETAGGERSPAVSHFGSGILTWRIPCLFRTPPGYNLLVRGPANWFLDGASALEGLVETDWAVATFTMNWKLTRPDHQVTFPQGFPVAMVVPQARHELERFEPLLCPLASEPELKQAYLHWRNDRRRFNKDLRDPLSAAAIQRQWQKHYFHGVSPDGLKAPHHQVKLSLRVFADKSMP